MFYSYLEGLGVCMYVCLSVCMYVCMYVYILYKYRCIYRIYIYANIQIQILAYLPAGTVNIYMQYMYIHLYIYTIYIKYIHTHVDR